MTKLVCIPLTKVAELTRSVPKTAIATAGCSGLAYPAAVVAFEWSSRRIGRPARCLDELG
jgi:hypothetical protein